MIPNRHALALDPVENLAESADRARMQAIARETGNWSLVGVLRSLRQHQQERQKKTNRNRRNG